MTQFLLWIIPPIFYFLTVLFFRKQVEEPHLPKIWYWGTIPMFIPILGLIAGILIIILVVVGLIMEEIEFKEDTKFAKKWLD